MSPDTCCFFIAKEKPISIHLFQDFFDTHMKGYLPQILDDNVAMVFILAGNFGIWETILCTIMVYIAQRSILLFHVYSTMHCHNHRAGLYISP